jgi:PKD repeat protein
MTGLDRRQVLRSVGAGAGAGLTGLGTASARRDGPETDQEIEATFTATVGSGFLVINGNDPDDEEASINLSLSDIEGEIVLNGEIYEDRTWQSADITFPEVDPAKLIDPGNIDIVDSIDFNDETEINVIVNSINGVYDPYAEGGPLVTGSLDMAIEAFITGVATVDVVGGIDVPFDFDFSIDFNEGQDITLTTAESQNLSGEADTLHCADPVVRVVSNDFTVPAAVGNTEECVEDIECIDVNDQLELPSDVPFQNFIELDLDIEWDDNQPFAPAPVVGENSPRDLDCDGNYDDLDGDGELTVMDVQKLFELRNDEQLESNAELYDFSDSGTDRISIFDVQGLYTRLLQQDE